MPSCARWIRSQKQTTRYRLASMIQNLSPCLAAVPRMTVVIARGPKLRRPAPSVIRITMKMMMRVVKMAVQSMNVLKITSLIARIVKSYL